MAESNEKAMVLPEFMGKSTEERVEESTMSPVEQEEFVSVVKAMSDEEKLLVVKAVSNEVLLGEVARRLSIATATINKIKGVLAGQVVE